jgi:hypothetical protein
MSGLSKAELEKSNDELSARVARLAHSDHRNRRDARKNYEALRLLENEVRLHTYGQCACRSWRECIVRLGRMIPTKARPKSK